MHKSSSVSTDIGLVAHRSRLNKLAVNGGSIAYLDEGPRDGTPIVLVHGMPTSSWLYRRIAEQLANQGFRVIAPDLLGFGASDKPKGHEVYSMRNQSDRIIELLDHLKISKAIFTGHDLGGPWVFEIVDRHPEKIAGLVVLNTSAYAELMKPPLQARMVGGSMGPMMLKIMGSKVGKPMIHKFFVDFTGTGKALSKDVSYGYWLPLHEGGTRAFRAFAKELKNMMAQFSRYSDALRRLDVPAILIWGDKDPVLCRERMVPRFVADLKIKPEDVHVLSGASHFLQEDRPDEIARLISAFLRSRSADFRS